MRHLKKAQSSNIKRIKFIRRIGRLDIYDNSTEYENEDDCYIYEVILENDVTHYVNFRQINDIIGDEEWTGRRQMLVQFCIILNHVSFFGSKKEGIH